MFRELKDRGLQGVELLVSDANGGIRSAMARHLQGVAWQRCQVHLKRELASKVSYTQRAELMKDVASVFAGEDERDCLQRGEEAAQQWSGRYPKLASQLREGLADCLTVLQFPAHHRMRLKSTNLLENLMKQLKKRTKVVGVFPNRAACDRLIGAQLIEVHERWQTQTKAYFNMTMEPPAR